MFNKVLTLAFVLASGLTTYSQNKSFLVQLTRDSALSVTLHRDILSQEAGRSASAGEKDNRHFRYYILDVVSYSSINGLQGLLKEWGAANTELAGKLNQYNTFLEAALRPGANDDTKQEFPGDDSGYQAVNVRYHFFWLLKFVKQSSPKFYDSLLNNRPFIYAIRKCYLQTNALLEQRNQALTNYAEALCKSGEKARYDGEYLWMGNAGTGTFGAQIKEILALQEKAFSSLLAEIKRADDQFNQRYSKKNLQFIVAKKTQFLSDDSKAAFFKNIAALCAPEAYSILSQVPAAFYARYATDTTMAGLLEDLNTVVHESCHALNHKGYFVSEKIFITCEPKPVFNSHELIKSIPPSTYKTFFRHDYVFVERNLSSQVSGIYGLLNEFCAYYHGDLIDWQIAQNKELISSKYPAYRAALNMEKSGSTLDAFYEFSTMMSWYLQYARKNYPKDYETIMNDKSLRVAFTLLYERSSSHVKRNIQAGYNPKPAYVKLYEEALPELNKLKLVNCNEGNYMNFLK